MVERYVETYRGCAIYHYDAGDITPGAVYGTPCVTGYWNTLAGCKNAIDRKLGAVTPPPPPPPEEEDRLVETYRAVEIWWIVSLGVYRAQVAAGYVAVGYTLTEIRAEIDGILEFLNPPPPDEEGLLAQLWSRVTAWIEENIQGWVTAWGKVINNTINNVYQTLQNTYNYVTENITNIVNNAYEYITNTYNYLTENISNVYNYLTENITNVVNNTYEYITNVVGASTEWVATQISGVRTYVDQKVAGIDTVGFFKDPLGYIGTAFTGLIDAWVHGAAGSLAEGLQEGLQGSNPGPEGPGRSFALGFEEAVREEEGHVSRG